MHMYKRENGIDLPWHHHCMAGHYIIVKGMLTAHALLCLCCAILGGGSQRPDAPQVRHERVATWLQSRAAAVRSLRLRVSGSSQELRAADESELGPEPVFDISCMHNFGRQDTLRPANKMNLPVSVRQTLSRWCLQTEV